MAKPEDSIQRSVLPIPDVTPIGLTTFDAKDPDTKYPPIGGRYGSGVPIGISGYFFVLSSNASIIFSTGPIIHESRIVFVSSSCGFV